ncbi:MAG TPA: energy-coupling factor transporter transmembrane protein EcfT [Firmicutes bacterium]|nr:cobalt transport protein [Clostridium sp. CAG:288]HAR48099.1 energy-coupling factor transporter transmembrane protein EcfT [Bacillota bacterium]HAW99910.1 energy-coupling factor transporter transmembrane protein EcfT [Bacillota bacterium]HCY67720.1 energy-coupling factor transporter transmembrane protein EcfT [Bacillota bacterium]
MKNMALGRYIQYDTPMHRMDPRIKILGLIVFMVAIFLNYGPVTTNFIMYGLFFVIIFILMKIGKIKFKFVLKSLKAIWIMVVFLLIINVLLTRTGDIAFKIGTFPIYWSGIFNTIYVVCRLVLMIMVTTVLTSTTKPLELTFGLEWLMTPLKFIKVPVSAVSMTISLALRFIPTLTDETDRIMKAQASRGVDFANGKLKDKVKSIVSLIIPLFMSAFSRSAELADAMESRGYNPDAKRTRYRVVKWSIADTIYTISLCLFLGGIITLAVLRPDIVSLISGLFTK